jgi:hypothetical protein
MGGKQSFNSCAGKTIYRHAKNKAGPLAYNALHKGLLNKNQGPKHNENNQITNIRHWEKLFNI